jgi:hypothetical protein
MNIIRESVLKDRAIAADGLFVRSDRFVLSRTEFGPAQFRSLDFELPSTDFSADSPDALSQRDALAGTRRESWQRATRPTPRQT